ncbi:MAG TPA: hypothetical protein DCZ92_14765 [Elusimicrobia bacterium]|nr:MAG: hypothetical protein A2016_11960 [Elusimicrobia bacterium GWF2_62_30]HBA62044.1 hypothetical protein [Elusimicrobiota bacterium]
MNEKLLNRFYYLAPLWFLLETFLWPDFRAGLVVGPGAWWKALFYTVEGGIGAALYFRLPYADASALAENIAYLVAAMKFVLITPLDIALSIGDSGGGGETLARKYTASMPGIVYSMFYVGIRLSAKLSRK